jgi:TonB family protein
VAATLSIAVLASAAFTTPVPLLRPVDVSASTAGSATRNLRKKSSSRSDTLPVDNRTYSAKQVDTPATILSDSPVPAYPAAARKKHLSGEVRVAFVVGTDGRVEPGSTRIRASNNVLFSDAVTGALPRMRFKPAEYRGRRVRQNVEQPFTFELSRDK